MVCQPGVEQRLVADRVEGGDDDVWRGDLVGLHLHLGDLVGPRKPVAGCDGHLVVQDGHGRIGRQGNSGSRPKK